MFYEGSIYRPPSEAESLILQVTVGCRHNSCTFCTMYKDKTFRVKSPEEIKSIIQQAKLYPRTERIFLADGNALTMETELLTDILHQLYANFPTLKRVGIYANPKDILGKTDQELSQLKNAGLDIVYMGLESGSARVLHSVAKGVTPGEAVSAGQRVMSSGLTLSCTIILGLGGRAYSKEHAVETAKVVNQINPHYLAALTLMVDPRAPMARLIERGEFELLSPLEAIAEIHTLVQNLEVSNCVFRSNHASNYLPLKAVLSEQKGDLLSTLETILENNLAGSLRPESWRGL